MKKKGLIISTVVMVVVLIAAITTGTYAWFSVANTTKVEDITVSVAAGSDVRIGVAKQNAYKSGATEDDFVTGTVTWGGSTAKTWTGSEGLGTDLTTGLSFNFNQAVYTGTEPSTMDASGSWDPTHKLLAANNNDGNDSEAGTATLAVENGTDATQGGQYLHLPLGISAAKDNFDTLKCIIEIDLTSNPRLTLGMNAALSYVYEIDKAAMGDGAVGAETKNNEPQEFFTSNYSDTLSAATDGNGKITIDIVKTGEGTKDNKIDPKTIYQLDLYIFINGYDDDCVTNATGSACTIKISFVAAE